MRRLRAVIPIALALGIAAASSFFLYRWLQVQRAPKEVVKVVESEAVPVVVAAADLIWGSKIESEMVKTLPYLKESLPLEYFPDPTSVVGRVLISPLKPNEPILASKLAPEDVTTGGVSAVLKPGKRAIGVKGDKVIGISGFIHPGDRVDVLVSVTDPETEKEMTKLVLQNIPVLATGTEIQKNGKKSTSTDVYTLEVTPEEGEKLALAATQGKLQFALRNATDSETVLTRGATIPETLASFRYPSQPESDENGKDKPVKRVYKPRFSVQVIKGDQVDEVEF